MLDPQTGQEVPGTPPIIDVRLIHATGGEWVLTGLERCDRGGRIVDHAQTWRITPVAVVGEP